MRCTALVRAFASLMVMFAITVGLASAARVQEVHGGSMATVTYDKDVTGDSRVESSVGAFPGGAWQVSVGDT